MTANDITVYCRKLVQIKSSSYKTYVCERIDMKESEASICQGNVNVKQTMNTLFYIENTDQQCIEPTYTEVSGGVVESTYAVVYANTGPSDVPMYDPLIVPTLPVPVTDFKHHVTNCHSNNNFSDQYTVHIHAVIY